MQYPDFIGWRDLIDIAIMSVLVYQLYRWFRNTRALQVVIGLGVLGGVYLVTKKLGFFMTSWILQELGTVLFVLIIVVFQAEIRQALYRFSLLRHFIGRHEERPRLDLVELAECLFSLARQRTGALVVFQRQDHLDEFLLHGVPVDALASGPLLESIFRDGTPLHDGAAVIRENRLTLASCHLPLSAASGIPQYLGTRHRAALGLSELSDALVVVVSEERGTVTVALDQELRSVATPEALVSLLHEYLQPSTPAEAVTVTWRRGLFVDLVPKLVIFLLVVATWLTITSRQGGIVTVTAPLKVRNLPASLALLKTDPEGVEVQVKSYTSLVPLPKPGELAVDLDLAGLKEGSNDVPVTAGAVKLPLGLAVSGITPQSVRVTVGRKVRRQVRVEAQLSGRLPAGVRLRSVRVEPSRVQVEGPEPVLAGLHNIRTEPVDLSGMRESTQLERRLQAPVPQVTVLQEGSVRVKLQLARP